MELQPPDPPLADDAVLLRRWRDDDAAAIVAACQDPEISRWTMIPHPYTDGDARGFLEHTTQSWAEGRMASFALLDRETGRLAGSVALRLVAPHVGDVGYWAAPEARGRGLTTRAVRLVVRWGVEQLGLARVQLSTLPGNTASERVAQKAGFTREGLLQAAVEQRGERRDVVMWSYLPGDEALAGRRALTPSSPAGDG